MIAEGRRDMRNPGTESPRRRTGAARFAPVFALLGCAVAGCGSPTMSYVHPNVDFGYMERAAVLPFRNLTHDALAGKRVQSIFLMELLEEDVLTLVDPRETDAAMRRLGIPPEAELTTEQCVRLGAELQVQALFYGVIEEYSQGQGSRTRGPEITAVFGMIETQTGAAAWKSQVHENGASIWKRLFGGSPDDVYTVSRDAVRRALRTLL
jgi:hypothetical protein